MTTDLGQSAASIKEIERLAGLGLASVTFTEFPEGMVPPGSVIEKPSVAVIRQGDGRIVIDGLSVVRETLRGKPSSRQGKTFVTTLESFVDLVNHDKGINSVVFVDANWKAPSFTAIIDYHLKSDSDATEPKEAGDDELARFCRHRVIYKFPLSEPWKVWNEQDGKKMEQADFASFLEDHIQEISSPSDAERALWEPQFKTKFATPNELIDLARGLEVRVNSEINNRVRLQTGEIQLVYKTSHSDADGNDLIVPGLFLLNVPVFYKGEDIRIPVRLRFRAGSGMTWFFELFRPDTFVDERITDDVSTVTKATGLPAFYGSAAE